MKVFCYLSGILVTLSYLISLIISFVVMANSVSKEEYVYYLSKIATMKNIVKINHYSKIFDHFNSDGELEGITTKYHRLLNLTTKDGCKKGYKKCGILDTIGNTLCIDQNFGCPINNLTVDLLGNKKNYMIEGMKEIYNENLIYNYKFYYSNTSLNGNNIVSLLFTDEEPKYITKNNFILDLAAFKDIYNDNLNNNNNDKNDNGMQFAENIINIFVSDKILETLIKASFTLFNLIIDSDNDKEKFKDYVEERLETEENDIDKYYINVGENAYIKNYIGFKSLKDINKYFDFDYNIYKYNYPTRTAYKLAMASGIIGSILFTFGSCFFCGYLKIAYDDYESQKEEEEEEKKENNDNSNTLNINEISKLDGMGLNMKNEDLNKNNNICQLDNINNKNKENIQSDNKNNWKNILKISHKCRWKDIYLLQFFLSAVFVGINLALLIYSAWILHKNNRNKTKLNTLKYIESDDFIQSFLNEFREKCAISSLIIPTISIIGSSILIHIIGIIIFIILIS